MPLNGLWNRLAPFFNAVYARAGFIVQTVLMDNEFEKLQDYSPMLALNIPAANDHVGNVERRIRVLRNDCAASSAHCDIPASRKICSSIYSIV